MKSAEMLELLRAFYRDKLALRQRHVAAARYIKDYELNNAYQYIIAREDVQVRWLQDAIVDMGGQPEDIGEPDVKPQGKGKAAQNALLATDRDLARAMVDTWRPRIDALPNARHRSMLRVILGETLEHQRMFEQALGGRTDVLGRRADGAGTTGAVLATRWVE
ncbi:MAG: hypothetical protein WBC51_08945 [Vicinamibacterales bacterium]